MAGKLYIVSTPIGNLKDITLRALEVLNNVDYVFAEDTRVAKKLLAHFDIKKPAQSLHSQNQKTKINVLLETLQNYDVAFVVDAGTPGISDPGAFIVSSAKEAGFDVEVIPGPSALTAAIAGCGVDMHKFCFLGFLPSKKGRQKAIHDIATRDENIILYESVYRIEKLLDEIAQIAPDKKICIARELTKLHEEFLHGTATQLKEIFSQFPEKKKGEFVVILYE